MSYGENILDLSVKQVKDEALAILRDVNVRKGEPIEITAARFGYTVRVSGGSATREGGDKHIDIQFAMSDKESRIVVASELSKRLSDERVDTEHTRHRLLLRDTLEAILLMPEDDFLSMERANKDRPRALEEYFGVRPDLIKLRKKLTLSR